MNLVDKLLEKQLISVEAILRAIANPMPRALCYTYDNIMGTPQQIIKRVKGKRVTAKCWVITPLYYEGLVLIMYGDGERPNFDELGIPAKELPDLGRTHPELRKRILEYLPGYISWNHLYYSIVHYSLLKRYTLQHDITLTNTFVDDWRRGNGVNDGQWEDFVFHSFPEQQVRALLRDFESITVGHLNIGAMVKAKKLGAMHAALNMKEIWCMVEGYGHSVCYNTNRWGFELILAAPIDDWMDELSMDKREKQEFGYTMSGENKVVHGKRFNRLHHMSPSWNAMKKYHKYMAPTNWNRFQVHFDTFNEFLNTPFENVGTSARTKWMKSNHIEMVPTIPPELLLMRDGDGYALKMLTTTERARLGQDRPFDEGRITETLVDITNTIRETRTQQTPERRRYSTDGLLTANGDMYMDGGAMDNAGRMAIRCRDDRIRSETEEERRARIEMYFRLRETEGPERRATRINIPTMNVDYGTFDIAWRNGVTATTTTTDTAEPMPGQVTANVDPPIMVAEDDMPDDEPWDGFDE